MQDFINKVLPSPKTQRSSKEFFEKEELFVRGGDEDANERDFFGELIFCVDSSWLEWAALMSHFLFFIHDIREVLDSEKHLIISTNKLL